MNNTFLFRDRQQLPPFPASEEATASEVVAWDAAHRRALEEALTAGTALAFGHDFALVVVLAAMSGFEKPGLLTAARGDAAEHLHMRAPEAEAFAAAVRATLNRVDEAEVLRLDMRAVREVWPSPPGTDVELAAREVLLAVALANEQGQRDRLDAVIDFARRGAFDIW